MVTLEDGYKVCSACPEFRAECEAKKLLTYPAVDCVKALADREKFRGKDSTESLKARIEALRNKQNELRRAKAQVWLK